MFLEKYSRKFQILCYATFEWYCVQICPTLIILCIALFIYNMPQSDNNILLSIAIKHVAAPLVRYRFTFSDKVQQILTTKKATECIPQSTFYV